MKLQVIIKVPDVDKSDSNLSDDIYIGLWDKDNDELFFRTYRDIDKYRNHTHINVKIPVFEIGEIILVDEKLREIGGVQRKADKWDVSYKLFDLQNVEKAIELSKKVLKKYIEEI